MDLGGDPSWCETELEQEWQERKEEIARQEMAMEEMELEEGEIAGLSVDPPPPFEYRFKTLTGEETKMAWASLPRHQQGVGGHPRHGEFGGG